MKIRKLYIRGFGKIEKLELELSKNINVIYGPNESGKSTIMAYIKALLYGIKGGRTDREGVASDAKRFRPWSIQEFGGYINLELDNGKAYRLDRDFEGNTVKLYDDEFNDITGILSGSKDGKGISEKLIGIGESIFERTVFIKQLGTKIDASSSKELIDRISNLGQSGYEDISYKRALSALKEALKEQVGTQRSSTRPLDLINRRLDYLGQKLSDIREKEKSLWELESKLNELNRQIAALEQKEGLVSKAMEFYELKRRISAQRERSEEIRFLSENIDLLQRNLTGMADQHTALEQEALRAKEQGDGLLAELKALERGLLEVGIERLKKAVKYLDIAGIAALVTLISAMWASFLLKLLPEPICLIPGACAILAGIVKFRKGKNLKKSEEEALVLQQKEVSLQKQLDSVIKVNEIAEKQKIALEDRIRTETAQAEQQKNRRNTLLQSFTPSGLEELEKRADLLSQALMAGLEEAGDSLSEKETGLIQNVFEGYSDTMLQELSGLKGFYTEQLQQEALKQLAIELDMKRKDIKPGEAQQAEREFSVLRRQKKDLLKKGEALNIAIQTMEEAAQVVRKKLLPVMNKVFSSTFSDLTAQKYCHTRAGDNLNIMLNNPGTETVIPVWALSNGTIDQLYLSLRVAVSETVLKGNEYLPFIFDEPFAQYDDERTENALRLIGELSKRQQVIIFTCKQREVELISNLSPDLSCKICSLT